MEQYKITKAIRFKLKLSYASEIENTIKELNTGKKDFDLISFVENYLAIFIDDLENYLYDTKQNNSLVFKDKIIIKKEWLRQFAKQELINYNATIVNRNSNSRRQQITIKEAGVRSKIEASFVLIDKIYEELTDDAGKELNERAKRAKIGLLLRRLQERSILPLLISLIENSVDKGETTNLSISLKKQSREISSQLLAGIREYLPEESTGLPITRASFNYYTINKKPIDFSEEKESLQERLKVPERHWNIFEDRNKRELIKKDILKLSNSNQLLLLGDAPMLDIVNPISLRQCLKNIKAIQKEGFLELVQQGSSYSHLQKTNLYLFNDISESEFMRYQRITKDIEKKAVNVNQCHDENRIQRLRSELQNLKRERGSLINAADGRNSDYFRTYKKFAEFYRKTAKQHGEILSQLKGIEKESNESQLLKYWALILENYNQHKLVLIPKESAAECKKWLGEINCQSSNHKRLFWFESLTYRSLQKLCFGFLENGTNDFSKNIEMSDSRGYIINNESDFKGDEQEKIIFYQKVLDSDYVKKALNLPCEKIKSEIINVKFGSLDDFKIALEAICYRRFVVISDVVESELKKYNAQIFDITSLDLNNPLNIKNKFEKYKHSDKLHTKIWRQFWESENEKDNFDIRLNPEITITYREPKESRVHKYGKRAELHDRNKKNRYLYPQFTLVTTVSEHSNTPTKDLSFLENEEFKSKVGEFNKKIKKEDIKFAFGVDNGETELSTLGVYLPVFDKSTNEEKIKELKRVNDYGFKVLTIKKLDYKEMDYNGKERKIIQNPSYFLDKENYMRTFNKSEIEYDKMFGENFEEKTLLTLDLTTAKVISGYIVTNGDIPTAFNLWLKHAQRSIYEMNDHAKKKTAKKIVLKNNAELTFDEQVKFIEALNDYTVNSYEKYRDLLATVEGLSKKDKENYTAYHGLTETERREYTEWIFNCWEGKCKYEENEKFNSILGGKNREGRKIGKAQRVGRYSKDVLFACCYVGENLNFVTNIFDVRHVFKANKYFYNLKSEQEIKQEIESYNTRVISDEELDLSINNSRKALVSNVIGVIDFLYRQYCCRFNGNGLIVKEGLGIDNVEDALSKFSGNIYRILETKLYQKFQNYGLVPPIKNLMSVREKEITGDIKFFRLGNIGFINREGTSQKCPVCVEGRLNHGISCSKGCGFESEGVMHSNDGIAGFYIAKRGFENFI